jgi:hypothetical protein
VYDKSLFRYVDRLQSFCPLMSLVYEGSEKGRELIASSLAGPDVKQIRELCRKSFPILGGGEIMILSLLNSL